MHDSYLPAIIRTASPNLHIEPRRRSNRDEGAGALSLSPAMSRFRPPQGITTGTPPPAPVAQWIEQAPSKRLAAGSSPAGGATATSQNAPEGISPPGRFTSLTAFAWAMDSPGPGAPRRTSPGRPTTIQTFPTGSGRLRRIRPSAAVSVSSYQGTSVSVRAASDAAEAARAPGLSAAACRTRGPHRRHRRPTR
jgi:hypothetical protein